MLRVLSYILLVTLTLAPQGKGQELEEICPPEHEYWPHRDCTRYYHCDNGDAVEMTCPEGLYWDHNGAVCTFPADVPDCVGGTRYPESTTETSEEPATSDSTTEEPEEPEVTTEEPEVTTEEPEPTTEEPTTPEPTTEEPTTPEPTTEEPTTPEPTTEEPTTPEPTTEEPTTSEPTTEEPTTEQPYPTECPPEGITMVPYPGNCTLYKRCIDGSEIIYRCPFGYIFDTARLQCLPESEAVCLVEGTFVASILEGQDSMGAESNEVGFGFEEEKLYYRKHMLKVRQELAKKYAPFRLD